MVGFAISFRHGYDTTLMLADLAHINLPIPDRRPDFERRGIAYEVDGRSRAADVYIPSRSPRGRVVLVPGAAEGGRNDPRLVEFATALAHSSFLVLVPDVISLRELRPSAESVTEIRDAVVFLRNDRPLAHTDRLGMVAFSVATGPAVLAALNGDAPLKVDFLMLVGGYYDLQRTLGYLTTGYFGNDSQSLYRQPNAYGKWVYALSNASRLQDPIDRAALTALARSKLANPAADVGTALARLGPEGRSVYDFIVNSDPAQVSNLIEDLPTAVRSDIDALNLAGRDLSALKAQFILVHGYDDDVIPYTESISLAAALPQGQAKLFLLKGLHHVNREFSGLDAWRMWRVLRALLAQRD